LSFFRGCKEASLKKLNQHQGRQILPHRNNLVVYRALKVASSPSLPVLPLPRYIRELMLRSQAAKMPHLLAKPVKHHPKKLLISPTFLIFSRSATKTRRDPLSSPVPKLPPRSLEPGGPVKQLLLKSPVRDQPNLPAELVNLITMKLRANFLVSILILLVLNQVKNNKHLMESRMHKNIKHLMESLLNNELQTILLVLNQVKNRKVQLALIMLEVKLKNNLHTLVPQLLQREQQRLIKIALHHLKMALMKMKDSQLRGSEECLIQKLRILKTLPWRRKQLPHPIRLQMSMTEKSQPTK